jgi:hypothetical protein
VLIALYCTRSERLFCEQLGYNPRWLWLLERQFSEGSFNRSVFAKNYEGVLSAEWPGCSASRSMRCRAKSAGPSTNSSVPTACRSNPGPA